MTPLCKQVRAARRGALWLAFMVLLSGGQAMTARGQGTNVALGKKYVTEGSVTGGAPNYSLCSTERDPVKLTDGIMVDESQGRENGDTNYVGWGGAMPDAIVIDLEKIEPIAEVRFWTLSRSLADIYLPALLVGVGDDGQHFRLVGVWSPDEVVQSKTKVFRHAIPVSGLKVVGRYVKVCPMLVRGLYLFTDEIEVIRGDFDPATAAMERFPALGAGGKDCREQLRNAVRFDRARKLHSELVRQAAAPASLPEELTTELTAVGRQIGTAPFPDRPACDALYSRLCRLAGQRMNALSGRGFVLWQRSVWQSFQPHDTPPAAPWPGVLAGGMMINEYKALGFLITNTSGADQVFQVRADPLANGPNVLPPEQITLRCSHFIESGDFLDVPDVLPLADAGRVPVPAGQTRQVWLTVHTRGAVPGEYTGSVAVAPETATEAAAVRLQLKVYPVVFPREVPLATFNWSYIFTAPATRGIEKEAVADLRAHYVNTMILQGVWPLPEVGPSGDFTKPLDFTLFDHATRLCAGARQVTNYLSFADAGSGVRMSGLGGHAFMSEPWKKAYTRWLREIVARYQALGLDYPQFFYYPVDESASATFQELARFTKQIDPRLRIYANAVGCVAPGFAGLVDIICPGIDEIGRVLQAGGAATPKDVWGYICHVNGKRLPPHGYYRLQAWKTWKQGGNGFGFWYYVDDRDPDGELDSPWSFAGRCDSGGVVYDARHAPADVSRAEAVIPSRRWEAWREGVQDYTLLYLLRALVAAQRATGRPAADLARAEEAMAKAVDEVTAPILGEDCDPEPVERWREALLAELVRLWGKPEPLDGNAFLTTSPAAITPRQNP
jgi:hypothetical protein